MLVKSIPEALEAVRDIPFPIIVRPAFTLGGTGGGIAYNLVEFEKVVRGGLGKSPVHEVLVEEYEGSRKTANP